MLMFNYLVCLSEQSPNSLARAVSPQAEEVPRQKFLRQSLCSETETATLRQTEQENQRTKGMKGQQWKDITGRGVWIQQEVSEREGIIGDKSTKRKLQGAGDTLLPLSPNQQSTQSCSLNAHRENDVKVL